MTETHERFYAAAEWYDIAFDFKDVPAECDFLLETLRVHGLTRDEPRAFLELAAGPALHAREMARRGLRATALDLAPAMVAYGGARAAAAGVALDYVQGDMRAFALPERYDLAALLMDSVSYLLTNDAVIDHLRAVAAALRPGGLYVLEIAHPRDLFGAARSTTTRWESARGEKRVRVEWGHDDDPFDPVTQVNQTSVLLECWDGAAHDVLRETAPQRYFTATEWDALVRAAGCFERVELRGAMHRAVPFDNAKPAWRMVSVLRAG